MTANESAFTQLETSRLILRRFVDSDLLIIFAYRNHPQVARYQRWSTTSETGLKDFVQQQKSLTPGTLGEWFHFAIELKSTKELIGDCALKVYKEDDRQGEIGFTLAHAHQGQGFATEAVSLLLDHAFTKLGLYRIFAYTDCENRASIGLLERLKMRREGHILQSFQWKGERRDEYLYAILKDEWLRKRGGKK